MAVFALMMAAALLAADPDGVVATAPATAVDLNATVQPVSASTAGATQEAVPHGLSTDQQIDRWIAARSTADKPWSEAGREMPDDRKMHGEVTVAVGTGDYREYGVAVSLPIGETGRLDLNYREIQNGFGLDRSGYGYGYGYGYGEPYYLDEGLYAFPGYRTGAAAEFEWRAQRPGGPPRSRPLIEPLRQAPD